MHLQENVRLAGLLILLNRALHILAKYPSLHLSKLQVSPIGLVIQMPLYIKHFIVIPSQEKKNFVILNSSNQQIPVNIY